MGLKQNTSILAQLPLRYMGGNPAGIRSMWGRADLRNNSVGQGISSKLAGVPSGHYAPSSWRLPYMAGQISAFTYVGATVEAGPVNVAGGRNAAGDISFAFTAGPSQLELVVSAVGSTSITFTLTGNAAAVLDAIGAIAATFTVGPSTLGAESGVFGAAQVSFTASVTARADGNIAGAVTPFTELSPQNLAAAVWSAIATEYNSAGTMGNKLNLASSGGIDYNALAQAVWDYVNRELTEIDSAGIASAVRAELTPELDRIDANITSRLASGDYAPAPSASATASAVLSAAESNPIQADIRKINNYTVRGSGNAASDPWGPA